MYSICTHWQPITYIYAYIQGSYLHLHIARSSPCTDITPCTYMHTYVHTYTVQASTLNSHSASSPTCTDHMPDRFALRLIPCDSRLAVRCVIC